MELNKSHREALLNDLNKAKEAVNTAELSFRNYQKNGSKEYLQEWFEIEHYLAIERVKSIEKALIKNEIDY